MKVELKHDGQYTLRVSLYPQWVEELGIRWTCRSSESLLLISSSLEEVNGVVQSIREEEADLQGEEGIEWVAPSSLHSLLPGEWSYPLHNVWDDPQEEDWAPTHEELSDWADHDYTSYKESVDGEDDDGEWGGFVRTHSHPRGETPKWKIRQEARKGRTIQRKEARRVKYR